MPQADLLVAWPRRRRGRLRATMAVVTVAAGAVAVAVMVVERTRIDERPTAAAEPVAVAEPHPASSPVPVAPAPVALDKWLAEVAADAGLGLVIAPEVAGEIVATFPAEIPWRRRLAALARVHGFSYRSGGGLIEVRSVEADAAVAPRSPRPEPAEHAELALPAVAAPIPAAEPATVSTVIRLTNARAVELAPVIEQALAADAVGVAADAGSNALVVAGYAGRVAAVERLVGELDVPKRSFLLEAQIVEITRSLRSEHGVRWLIESGDVAGLVDFPAAETPGEEAGIIVATSGSHTLRARISALEASGRVRIISRPRVIVLEGRPAAIESVRILRVRFPDRGSVVADADEVSVSTGERAVQEIPVGVSLVVEPAMQGQGKIALRITAESSNLGPPLPPDDIPEELSRRVETDVVVGDGETAVLGGLLRKSRNRSGTGVPVLRSIPLVGLLFGRRVDEHEGEELVVLITPHLLG